MKKNRTEYEKIIRSSILFTVDKEKQPIIYKREALKMVENLYLYLMAINEDKYGEYGLEIAQTANSCIRNYVCDNGKFLNYFNSAIAKEYRKAFAQRKMTELHGGVHIPDNEQRLINKYIKLSETRGNYSLSVDDINKISEATGIAPEQVVIYINAYQNSFTVENTYKSEDGEEISIFASIASSNSEKSDIENIEEAIELLDHISDVFDKRQERQKPLLSKLLTAKISLHLLDIEPLIVAIKTYHFFDEDVFRITYKTGLPPTAKEIASSFNITEQSVSRTYRSFLALL